MTRTTPLRLMTLHLGQMGFTEARTFISLSLSLIRWLSLKETFKSYDGRGFRAWTRALKVPMDRLG